jgi:alpha-glucosidase
MDSNGDGVGDLPGIMTKLDYVASLGVDGIWLCPFFPSPMKDFGYDVADYWDVAPLFGSFDDFKSILAKAHQLDLKVVIDLVWSHTSDEHPWFAESRQSRDNPKADWYVWAEPNVDGLPPNNWLSYFDGVAWEWDARREQYYLHNFLHEQPDLNIRNPEVQDALLEVGRFWLDLGVDGCRFDVANFFMHDAQLRDNPPNLHPQKRSNPYFFQNHIHDITQSDNLGFIERMRQELFDRYPGSMGVAEILCDSQLEVMAAYTQGEERLHTAYSFVFFRSKPTPKLIRHAVETAFGPERESWPSWAFSNHDVIRAVSRLAGEDGDRAAAKLLLVLISALPGNAFIYQGEELGLPHAQVPFDRLVDPEAIAMWPNHHRRDGARTPMPWHSEAPQAGFSTVEPWLPVDERHLPLAVDRAEADKDSPLWLTRRWLAFRKQHPALIWGDFRFVEASEAVLWFERFTEDEKLIGAFNMSVAPVRLPLEAKAILFAEAAELRAQILELGAYGWAICE